MWETKVITIIRNMLGDVTDSPEYTDNRLLQLFLVCSTLVLMDVEFDNDYAIDISNETITPDPSDDKDFLALACLKSVCTLLNSEVRSKHTSGMVSIKDGPSTVTIDNRDVLNSLKDLAKTMCAKYEQSIFEWKSGQSVAVAILTPYSPGSDFVGRVDYPDRNLF